MATTINSGYANSPKLTANIADHADVYGGRALVFDGVTDYLTCGTGLGNQLGNGYSKDTGLTASLWFKNDGTIDGGLFQIGNNGGAGEFSFQKDNNNEIYFLLNGNGWHRKVSFTDTSNWHHIVCIYGSSEANSKIYLDGEAVGTAGGSFPSTLDFNGLHTTIGNYWNLAYRFNGKITDVKVFNTELTEAQVTELYLKPENTPSAVQDNLVAWYPMIEGNPESPQSIVYDHSEKGLGSDFARAVTADNWNAYANMTVNTITGGISIVAPTTASGVSVSSNGAYIYFRGGTFSGENQLTTKDLTVGKTYCVTFNAFYSGGLSGAYADINNGSSFSVFSDAFTTTNKSYKMYFTAGTATTALIRFQQIKLDNTVYITDIEVKEVLMGNHATTNFFGDELVTNGTFDSNTTGWTGMAGSTLSSESGGQSGNYLKVLTGSTNNPYAQATETVEANKQYYFSFYHKDVNSSNDIPKYAIYDISNSAYIQTFVNVSSAISSSSWVQQTNTFTTPSGCTSVLLMLRHTGTANDNSYFGFDTVSLKEVGISSSGFETAVNEPVVPQVPLMRYNQKAIFYRNKNNYVSLTEQTLGANTAFTISFSFTPFADQEHHMIGKNHTDDTIRIDTAPAYGSRVHVRISGSGTNFTGLGNININEPAFYTITRTTGGVFSVYRNGIKSSTSLTSTADFKYQYLGQALNNTWESDGLLDEFSIFNTHFSDSQVQELFNDGVAYDATTHSKASTLKAYYRNDGVTTWKNRGDKFASFDGVDDVITRNAINVDYKSISLWVRPSNTFTPSSSAKPLLGFGNWSYNNTTFGSATSSFTGELITLTDNDGSTKQTAWIPTGGETIPNDSWTHLAFVWDGSKYIIYYNGQPQTVNANSAGHYPLSTNKNIRIATGGTSSTGFFDGDIANIAFWSESLTDAQVLSIYNAGQNGNIASIQSSDLELYYTFNPHASTDADTNSSVQDRSGNNRDSTSVSGAVIDKDGTVQGSPDSITIREGLNSNRDGLGFYFTNPSSNVLRLNGVDEQIIVPDTDFNFSGQMTFECWAKNNSDNNTVNEFLISQWNYSNNQRAFRAFIHSNGALYCTISDTGSGSNTSQVNTTNAISNLDNWHHYAFTFSSGTFVIYIDGVAVTISTGSVVASITSIHNSTADIQIGSQYPPNATGGEWNGLIDEVKIYNRALSLAEIQKNYKHQKGKHKND